MLIEFSIGNFRSFRDKVTFSMVAAALKSKNPQVDDNNVFSVEGQPTLLTSAAIYGANASGKSNLIKAIGFMRKFVLNSTKETQAVGAIGAEPFALHTETAGKPSHFEMVFVADDIRYRYGFEATTERVVSEWLFHVPTKVEARLFERTQDEFHLSGVFKEGKGIQEKTRPNTLFLSAVAQWNGEIAQRIVTWFRKLGIASGLEDTMMRFHTMESLAEGDYQERIIEMIRSMDLAIEKVTVEMKPMPEIDPSISDRLKEAIRLVREKIHVREELGSTNMGVATTHHRFDADGNRVDLVNFDMDKQESDGTQKLFALSGPIVRALQEGRVLIVDELDARLHPLMTCGLVKLFNSRETNPRHAQLIFTTHDTNLLDKDLFRRDQIWFTEKDRQGATDLYSLAEFKIKTASQSKSAVRNDASFEKDYIAGRYGAIPFLGDLHRMGEGQ
ncbi:MAG: ATP-binding protein [Chloroflexi bacterium]|nr:MAG: ATP-binding protein [Chloroflexota bacterium]